MADDIGFPEGSEPEIRYEFTINSAGECRLEPPAVVNPAHVSIAIGSFIALLVQEQVKEQLRIARAAAQRQVQAPDLQTVMANLRRGQS